MTLAQIKTFIVGVLKGWFTNKSVLDKFSESEEGKLLYNAQEIGGSVATEEITDEEMQQAITDTITELNTEEVVEETETVVEETTEEGSEEGTTGDETTE